MYDCNIMLVSGSVAVESRALCDYANYHVFMFLFCGSISVLLMLIAGIMVYCRSGREVVNFFAKWSLIFCCHAIGFEGALVCFYLAMVVVVVYSLLTFVGSLTYPVYVISVIARSRHSNAVVSIEEHHVRVVVVDEVCSICLENGGDSNPWFSTSCGHGFHLACIEKWKNSTCPLCRGVIGLN
jgi:hypothetical protein